MKAFFSPVLLNVGPSVESRGHDSPLGAVTIVNTTPQMTRFRGAKVCNKWLQVRIDDHRIQSDY